MTMNRELWQLLTQTIKRVQKPFYFHMIMNMIINAMLIPLLDQWSVTTIINKDIAFGVKIFITVTITECISRIYKIRYTEPERTKINAIAHELVDRYVLEKLEKISNDCQKKLLEGDYQNKKNALKWSMINLIKQLNENIIQFIPMVVYIIWIGIKSPFTIITYTIGISLTITYTKAEFIGWEGYDKNWKEMSCYRNNQYSDLVHGRGKYNHDKLSKFAYKNEILTGTDQMYDTTYVENINMAFDMITIINCLIMLFRYDSGLTNNNIDATFMVIYIQYIRTLKGNLQLICTLIKQWHSTKKEYNNYEKLFIHTVPDTDTVNQIDIKNNISIMQDSRLVRNDKLLLKVSQTITLEKGKIVYVAGVSGSGKTTLFDVMAGVIKHCKTSFKIKVDGVDMEYGFEHLKRTRIYLATNIQINPNQTNVEKIVSSNRKTTNLASVNEALQMSECTFVTDITRENITYSKGQINRLKVARYLYDILIEKPSMVILDEIADGVDPETTIKIAENIYTFFRKNNILCLVATHLPYLQTMNYDLQINIDNGKLYI